jgi:hypothetical protein
MKFDFTKNRTVDDIAVVPENCRAFYDKTEGDDGEKYTLKSNAETTAAVAIITGQNKALGKVRDEVNAAKTAKGVDLTPLNAYGTTVEEIAANVGTKVQELTDNASGKESDVAARIAKIKQEHGEAVAKLTAEHEAKLGKKDASLHDYMLNTAIMTAGSTWENLNTKLIAPFARSQMAVQEIDGKPCVVIVGSDGEAKYSTSPDRAGDLMNTEELLAEMSEDKSYRQLFPSTQAATGSGAQPKTTPRNRQAAKNMTAAEKIAHGLKSRK